MMLRRKGHIHRSSGTGFRRLCAYARIFASRSHFYCIGLGVSTTVWEVVLFYARLLRHVFCSRTCTSFLSLAPIH